VAVLAQLIRAFHARGSGFKSKGEAA
jgi:hypothetical protein